MLSTELIGSIPRTTDLIKEVKISDKKVSINFQQGLTKIHQEAIQKTIYSLEQTGSQILTDGEQSKPSYLTYAVAGLSNIDPDGVVVQYIDGHGRRLPKLTSGPFSYYKYSGDYLINARKFTTKPLKQTVISPSSMFLMYPKTGVDNYTSTEYLQDVIGQSEMDIRSCFAQQCACVQIDAPETAMSIRIDPTGELLKKFISVNNVLLDRFSNYEQSKLGIHICCGSDQKSSLCTEEEYISMLPDIFSLHTNKIYIPLERFQNKTAILQTIRKYARPWVKLYFGIIDVTKLDDIAFQPTGVQKLSKRIETIARFLPLNQIATSDDCGFASFADNDFQSREAVFDVIRKRVQATNSF